ncbi:MAG: tyrosine-protein phosphatase [Gaiellaceae bacterium MAG52_C11]|nr:tyrosine-protein phosphatase [Candidatus Gaiellasilicea maunaloa]
MRSTERSEATLDRRLAWDGCANVRDLGGHPVVGGGTTAYGAVVRADSVRRLSEAGWRQLVDYGIETIVDLRMHDELAADPPDAVPVNVVHVPVLPEPDWPHWHEIDTVSEAALDGASSTQAVYLEFLDRFAKRFAAAISAVAAAPPGGVLVHCMVGKDRTGLVVALLLRLAGVPVAEIAADYAQSEHNLFNLTRPWIEEAADERERARRERLSATPAQSMEGVLREVDRRGGTAAYLAAAGVRNDELVAVRARLRG